MKPLVTVTALCLLLGQAAEGRRDLPAARRHYAAALTANPRLDAARKALARIGQ